MTKYLIQEAVNIDICPKGVAHHDITNITLGDLHANAIKFLYFLVRHHIISLDGPSYTRLAEIYRMWPQAPKLALLAEYVSLLDRIHILDTKTRIRLIGDELADRGSNDYFILKIIEKLHQNNVNMEILLSNHGGEFIEAYERFEQRAQQFEVTRLGHFAVSLDALSQSIDAGFIQADEIFRIIQNHYKPLIKLISYSLDHQTQTLTLYSHAAIGLRALRFLAQKFKTPFEDAHYTDLAKTITAINEHFIPYIEENRFHELYHPESHDASDLLNENNVLEFTLWNRQYNDTLLERPEQYKGYLLSFVHGHDKEPVHNHIYGLDTNIGKALHLHTESYLSLASNELEL